VKVNSLLFSSLKNFPQTSPMKAYVLGKSEGKVNLFLQGEEVLAETELNLSPGQILQLLYQGEKDGKLIFKLLSATSKQNIISFLDNFGLSPTSENLNLLSLFLKNNIPLNKENFLKINTLGKELAVSNKEDISLLLKLLSLKLLDNKEVKELLKFYFQKEIQLKNFSFEHNPFSLQSLKSEELKNFLQFFLKEINFKENLILFSSVLKGKDIEFLNFLISQYFVNSIRFNFSLPLIFFIPFFLKGNLNILKFRIDEKNKKKEDNLPFKISILLSLSLLGLLKILLSFYKDELYILFFVEKKDTKNLLEENFLGLENVLKKIGFKKIFLKAEKKERKIIFEEEFAIQKVDIRA
jgi:hypothetical protein